MRAVLRDRYGNRVYITGERYRKGVETFLEAMLFKDEETGIVEDYLSNELHNDDWGIWNKLSRNIIGKLRNKPYELPFSVSEFRKRVFKRLSSGKNFNPKLFGKRTNTNTLLSALAISLLPKEVVRNIFKDKKTYEKFLEELLLFPGDKPENFVFWRDVISLIVSKVEGKDLNYLSALYYNDLSRVDDLVSYLLGKTIGKTTVENIALIGKQFSDAVDKELVSFLRLKAYNNSSHLLGRADKLIEYINFDRIEEKDFKYFEWNILKEPALIKNIPTYLSAALELVNKKPELIFLIGKE